MESHLPQIITRYVIHLLRAMEAWIRCKSLNTAKCWGHLPGRVDSLQCESLCTNVGLKERKYAAAVYCSRQINYQHRQIMLSFQCLASALFFRDNVLYDFFI